MKILPWVAPCMTALAGLAAGIWLSSEIEGGDETVSWPLAKATTLAVQSTLSASGTLTKQEEVMDAAELLRLWQQHDMAGTLAAFVAYAREDPALALELAMNLEGPDAWELVMNLVLQLPPQVGGIAMDVLLRHPQYCEACPVQHAVFWLCAKSDPERAWREAHVPGVTFLDNALDAIASGCGEANPRLAMTFAARLTQPDQKEKFTRNVLREWSASDAPGLVAWITTQEDRGNLAMQVPWGKMRFDTEADFLAMAQVVPLELLDGSLGERFSFGTAADGGWATRLDWLQALPEGATRAALFAGAARALIGADPEQALALVPEITNARLKQQVISATAAYRAAVSPQEGFAFADSLTDENMRQLARQSVLRTWAENDPVAAARYALSAGESGRLLSHLGFKWAEIDPQSAVSHALAYERPEPGTSVWSTMFGTAMNRWIGTDPYGASRWVNELPAGEQRDRAVSTLALTAARSEPDGAMNWAAGVADEALRRQTVEACFKSWLGTDRSQAAAWLEQAALDVATRQTLATALQTAEPEQLTGGRTHSTNGIIVVY